MHLRGQDCTATMVTMRKSLRFAVLERDQFRCRYCGRPTSETVILEVDHIHPRSKGGSDEMGNLATACWDCNSGKGAKILRPLPPRRPRGPRIPSVGPDLAEREMEDLAARFPVGSHCATPLKIATIGAQFGLAGYAAAYRFVKHLPKGDPEVPMPPQRRSDASWMRFVDLDFYHQQSLVMALAEAIDRH